ncbi:short-chain dehydrogenase [Flavobacterium sp. Leaf82]|jgi:NAD(P)-dependent dehydrogenase (short-subunit alcohol dehydrogenase family)|uniref:SDR family NAD(P)-dependent oxidoreductase n=1 Tax=unclassified Flavobacterium TaxID=196869 RepID=UPI0006F8FC9A|nr:SDR family oxidoreductase [Flavobacterium sp. Leaf82]KQO33259.1 short-chain dehydrogenase [Flavobacterium sp. Leaf82]
MEKKQFVLVTGATSGIGKEIAIQLSNDYNLVLHGRNLEKLNEVLSLCNKKNSMLTWLCNLEKIEEVEKSLEQFLSNSIEIIKFVHCAGIMKMAPLKMSNLDILKQTFNINVFAPNLISKTLISKKINNSSLTSIVFISSNISNHGAKAMSAYGSSKSALDGLMRSLAVELAPKVRVNSVLPGAVETSMTKDILGNEELKQRMLSVYPLGIGLPNDISQAVSFLLSENARWITGQQITVDGGRTINITG